MKALMGPAPQRGPRPAVAPKAAPSMDDKIAMLANKWKIR